MAEHHSGHSARTRPKNKAVTGPLGAQPVAHLRETPRQEKMSRGASCGTSLQKCSEAVENQSKCSGLTHLFTFGAFQSTNTICSLGGDKTGCYNGIGKLKSEESLFTVIFASSTVDCSIFANWDVPKHIANQISAADIWLLGHQRVPYSHKPDLLWQMGLVVSAHSLPRNYISRDKTQYEKFSAYIFQKPISTNALPAH